MSKKGSKQLNINDSYNSTSKNQTTQLKYGEKKWIDIFQRRYADGQQIYEKMLNIVGHQENANENHNAD